jgi:Tfp pilus assembly protein PilF
VSGGDPAKARVLRAQGLEALNKGAIDKAQDLLRQALRLDPGNALIQRDLDRANADRPGRARQTMSRAVFAQSRLTSVSVSARRMMSYPRLAWRLAR